MRGMGRALALLHGLPLPGLPVYDRCAAASRRAARDLVIRAIPHVSGLVETLALELDRRERAASADGALHGDVHPKNALADGPDVGLIDVEEMAWGARAADLGSLLARLCSARTLELETRDRVHRAAMALLEGYASVSPVPELPELRWHVAAAMLVERAQRAVTRLNGLALARLDRLVAEGLRLLDAEGVGL
jgi:Ser/Thr protein kinase RdoA (MazF antagonist)